MADITPPSPTWETPLSNSPIIWPSHSSGLVWSVAWTADMAFSTNSLAPLHSELGGNTRFGSLLDHPSSEWELRLEAWKALSLVCLIRRLLLWEGNNNFTWQSRGPALHEQRGIHFFWRPQSIPTFLFALLEKIIINAPTLYWLGGVFWAFFMMLYVSGQCYLMLWEIGYIHLEFTYFIPWVEDSFHIYIYTKKNALFMAEVRL